MANFKQILEYLQGSVQICIDSHRNFFKTSNKMRVSSVEHFLINEFNFQ